MSQSETMKDAIARIREKMAAALLRAGRQPEAATLMAVSKFNSLPAIQAAYNEGIRCFGESRVQEARDKFTDFLPSHPDVTLHLIGSLQRNKAKQAVEIFSCIESLDRPEIIAEVARRAAAAQAEGRLSRKLDVLLELNAGEASKQGFPDFDSLQQGAELVLASPALNLKGLMTMAPFTDDTRLVRQAFSTLRQYQEKLKRAYPEAGLEMLSMGMSSDFEIALEEGSTLIRIGTAIFGPRLYSETPGEKN